MNELNKLIEQYPGDKIRLGLAFLETKKDPYYWSVQLQEFLKFIQWMAKLASRPTCGKEQRLFLDEVENNFEVELDNIVHKYGESVIEDYDFDCDLRKVLQGE